MPAPSASPAPGLYGTLTPTDADVAHHPRITPGQEEASPLLGVKQDRSSSLRAHLKVDVARDRADIVLLLSYLITGMLDSASISTWGAFVSMQTGNTVYLGLGFTVGTSRWKKSGISILAFCIGSFAFSRLHRHFSTSPRQRWVLCLSFILQMLFIIAAASIVAWGPPGGGTDSISWDVVVPIALVAFQSCGQAVVSRALKYNTLSSVVLTSIYCDLFSDPGLFEGISINGERNRKIAAPILLIAGAICGGFIANSTLGAAGALWTAALLKLGLVLVWLFWPAEKVLGRQ